MKAKLFLDGKIQNGLLEKLVKSIPQKIQFFPKKELNRELHLL